MNIGQAATASGLPVKTVRYYEEVGLVVPMRQQCNAYRDYSVADIEHLIFLQRSRAVGFSVDICRELLDLYRNPERRCSQVKALVLDKIAQIENQLYELSQLHVTLKDMANGCAGDESSACTIIEALSSSGAPVALPSFTAPMPFTLVESHHD
jgi:MerR family transcriptional regulator, copper efflux regulator